MAARTSDPSQARSFGPGKKSVIAACFRVAAFVDGADNATKQTYVAALKAEDMFDAEKQRTALLMSLTTAKDLLDAEAKELIIETHGNLDKWLTVQVEAFIKESKIELDPAIAHTLRK